MALQTFNNFESGLDVRTKINANFTELYGVAFTPSGEQVTITSTGGAGGTKAGENLVATSTATNGQYSVRYAFLDRTGGNFSAANNDIADTLIARYGNITGGGAAWLRWDVLTSPLNPASGLPGAPIGAQSFNLVSRETNPQQRHATVTWQGEARRFANGVGGEQMVPETQDFSGLLGTGVRRGYNLSFGYLLAKSPYTNDDQQRHAQFVNGMLFNPNSIAPDGAALFATGYKQFSTAVAISAAGTGYTVGDLITFNTGLGQNANENTVLRVKTVGGSGDITSVEIYVSGWYQQSFASPIGVTGGTGNSATFTYTLSSDAEAPRAFAGVVGTWDYAIDAAGWSGTDSVMGGGRFLQSMFRAPNNTTIINARNAADNADVTMLKLNASDRGEFMGEEVRVPAAYVPTYTADGGTFTTVTTVAARHSVINGVCTFSVSFQVVSKGTATGAIRVSLPINAAFDAAVACTNLTSGVALAGDIRVASPTYARLARYDAADPIVDGTFYVVSGSYEV